MKIAITGSQNWGSHLEAAEEVVAGFISDLPKTTTILTGGEDEGPGIWANRYAKANKMRVTEFTPTQVKGAAFNVRNFSQRDKNIAENAERVFCFLYAGAETDPEIANLMTIVRLQHVAHTIYTLGQDEEDESKLKLVEIQEVEAKELLPGKETKVGPSTGKKDSGRHNRPKSTASIRSGRVQTPRPASRSRNRKPGPNAPAKRRVSTRHRAVEKVGPRTVLLTRKPVAGSDKRKSTVGTTKGIQAPKTIILKRTKS